VRMLCAITLTRVCVRAQAKASDMKVSGKLKKDDDAKTSSKGSKKDAATTDSPGESRKKSKGK
jgi:hypothetical protein